MATPPTEASSARITYLNDHLAGALTALELLGHLIDSAPIEDDKRFFSALRQEVAEDRETLQDLLVRLGGRQSSVRQLGGWLAEKASRLKFLFDDPARGTLERLEALEVLVLGIHGKQLLWRALARTGLSVLEGLDLAQLERRAADQHDRVEVRRLEAASRVLAD